MLIRQQIVQGSARLVSRGANTRTTITVHETGNTSRGADATAHANLQSRGNSRTASWHWTVDSDEAVQSYEHTARCWHAGKAAGNNTSISVEVCVNSDGDQMQAYRNAAELVRKIMQEENLPLAAVVQHNRWSGKNCPERLRGGKYGLDWAGFLGLVANEAQVTTPHTVAPPGPAPTPAAQAQLSAPTTYDQLLVDGQWGSATTTALQILLKKIGRYSGAIDGDFGPMTKTATQAWLKGLGHYGGNLDGDWGPMSRKALQSFLFDKGLYRNGSYSKAVLVDGDFGERSVRALQDYLNDQRRYL